MRVTRRAAIAVVSVAAALTLSACSSTTDEETTTETTSEVAEADGMAEEAGLGRLLTLPRRPPDLSTAVAAISAADLVGTLSGEGPFTVFAPTNAAF